MPVAFESVEVPVVVTVNPTPVAWEEMIVPAIGLTWSSTPLPCELPLAALLTTMCSQRVEVDLA